MKPIRYLLLLFVVLVASCSSDDNGDIIPINNCLDGQGVIVTETRVLGNFHSITSTVYADLLITQGPKEDVLIEAQQNILNELETTIVNGILRITLKQCVDINQAIKIHITIPDIKTITLTGVGDVVAQNDYDLPFLNIVLTGTGDFILRGTTPRLNITITGVGDVKSFQLISNICDVLISGVGDAEVFVNDELNVTITGTGTVFYKGNPVINSNITGTGSVIDAN